MTVAPQHPPVHSYDPGKDPMELVSTSSGKMERWRADALLLGETSAAIQARQDAVTTLDDIEQQKRELAAGQATLTIDRATFDAEKRAFADQAATLAGRLSQEWDRMEKLRADADEVEEPLSLPPGSDAVSAPGDPSNPSKDPEPSLALEKPDAAPGDPADDPTPAMVGERLRLKHPITRDQDEPPAGGVEFPTEPLRHPPATAQPVSPGLDEE